MKELVRIDGAYGEGGGQIVRTAIALAAIAGKPVEVFNVRAKVSKRSHKGIHLQLIEG